MRFVFLLSVFYLLLHSTYIQNGFVFLDHNDIEEQRAILPINNLVTAFIRPFGTTDFYRPMVTVFHSIDYALSGQNPDGYHWTNVLLGLVSLGCFVLFVRNVFGFTAGEIYIGALLFAVHPYAIFVVGSIIQRQEILLGIGILLTIYFHVSTRKKPGFLTSVATMASFFLALSTKETALFVIPAAIILWEIIHAYKWKSSLALFVGEGIVGLGYIILRWNALHSWWNDSQKYGEISVWIGTKLTLLATMLRGLVVPFMPSINDGVRITPIGFPHILFTAVLCITVFLLLKIRGNRRELLFAWWLTGILLMVGMDIVPVPRPASPHYGYIVLIGFIPFVLLVARGLSRKWRLYLGVCIAFWMCIAAYTTFMSGLRFQNDETLFLTEIQRDPLYSEGHFYLGNYFFRKGEIIHAQSEFEAALRENKKVRAYRDERGMLINLAGTYVETQNYQKADEYLSQAQVGAEGFILHQILYNRATIAAREGNPVKVIQLLELHIANAYTREEILLLSQAYQIINETEKKQKLLRSQFPNIENEDPQ